MARFQVDILLERAVARTRLDRFGECADIHLEGLRALADSIDTNQLDAQGRERIEDNLTWWLERCLNFERDLALHPQIEAVPTVKPTFIVGFGRTGSTFLHNLLSIDPSTHAPQLWELLSSSPLPAAETFTTDPRIEGTRSYLRQIALASPGIFEIHPSDAQAPDECHWMMRHGAHLSLRLPATGYWEWFRKLETEQLRRLYSYYRLQVKSLQLFNHRGRWLSKSAVHDLYAPVLFDVFPDARIIRLHRDPCVCIASLASLTAKFRRLYTPNVDCNELGRFMLEWYAEGRERSLMSLNQAGSRLVFDLSFDDLTRNPIAAVREMYAYFEWAYPRELENAMVQYVRSNSEQQRSHGHKYSLEDFGLSRTAVLDRLGQHNTRLADRSAKAAFQGMNS